MQRDGGKVRPISVCQVARRDDVYRAFDKALIEAPEAGQYAAVTLAVAHNEFSEMPAAMFRSWGVDGGVLCDLKCLLAKGDSDIRR